MSCSLAEKRILVGRTSKGVIVSVCKDCHYFSIPHFNYEGKKREVTFSLLSAEFVDSFENIDLQGRTDVEEFLNSIVTPEAITKTNKMLPKINKRFFRMQRKNIRRYDGAVVTVDDGNKYLPVDVADVEDDMTYWELIVKLWNKYNEEQTPKNLCKPYYRNFQEYIDSASFSTKYDLKGGRCFTRQDQEREPHFIYKLATGEEFTISFIEPKYLYPIPRKLTQQELDILVDFLTSPLNEEYKIKDVSNGWEDGVWTWNHQNYKYNNNSQKWFPRYKKIDENMPMPNYTKLNE